MKATKFGNAKHLLTKGRSKADFTVGNTANFRNKPWGSYFSKALFEGEEGLIYGERFAFQNRLG